MRRRVSMLARYLLLGALMNVLVAWAFMAAHGRVNSGWREYRDPRESHFFNNLMGHFFSIRRTGAEWVIGYRYAAPYFGYPTTARNPITDYRMVRYPDVPWWPSEAVTTRPDEFGVAAGWPLLSLSAWRTVAGAPWSEGAAEFFATNHWGLELLGPSHRTDITIPLILPLRPMWPGFVVNTLLYALVTAVAFEGSRALRARRRLARGLCPACAVPVTGLERCPECGLAAPARRRAAARLTNRQRLAVLARYLLLGALINVAASWALVAARGRVNSRWQQHYTGRFHVEVDRRLGAEWVAGLTFYGFIDKMAFGGTPEYLDEPWWPPEAISTYFEDFGSFGVAAGWPLLSFSAWRTVVVFVAPTSTVSIVRKNIDHWGVVLLDTTPNSGNPSLEIPLILPLRPIWRGFIVNTLAYALVIAIVFQGWPTFRARRRLAHGLCPACAYPITGLERCPECGLTAPTVRSPVPLTAAPPGGMLAR